MLQNSAKRFAGKLWNGKVPVMLNVLQCRGLKADTGLVGVPVDPDARSNLRNVLHQCAEAIKGVPEWAYYRQCVEKTINDRLEIVNSNISDEEAEEKLEFQLEVVIRHMKDELGLIPKMIEWEPWDVPEGHQTPMYVKEEVPGPPPPNPPHKPPPPPEPTGAAKA